MEGTAENISGVWPALLTPVNKAGEPELRQLARLVELLVKQGVDGLYILGSTGQGFLFTEKQREQISSLVLEVANGEIPVIVQVGALNTRESVRLAKAAQRDGAYGVSSVSPIYYSLSAPRVFEHYGAIGGAVDIPFFPYHLGNHSIFTNGDAGEYVKMILDIPNVRGMKLTTQNLYEIGLISNLSRGQLLLFSGADELMCQAAMCGTVGAIGSFFNLWGKECQIVRKAFTEGAVKPASDFMLLFQDLIFQVLPNVWSFLQQAMLLKYEVDIGSPNPPLGYLQTPWEEKKVRTIVESLEGFVAKNFPK